MLVSCVMSEFISVPMSAREEAGVFAGHAGQVFPRPWATSWCRLVMAVLLVAVIVVAVEAACV